MSVLKTCQLEVSGPHYNSLIIVLAASFYSWPHSGHRLDWNRNRLMGLCGFLKDCFFLQHLLSEVLHSPSSFFTSGTTDIFCLRFLMEAQLGALIKVEILNASHSEGTEWNMGLISYHSGRFSRAAAGDFFFLGGGLYLGLLGLKVSLRVPDSMSPMLVHRSAASPRQKSPLSSTYRLRLIFPVRREGCVPQVPVLCACRVVALLFWLVLFLEQRGKKYSTGVPSNCLQPLNVF